MVVLPLLNLESIRVTAVPPALVDLLRQLQAENIPAEQAAQEILSLCNTRTVPTGEASVDIDRHRRCGFPEVVFGQGKTPEAITEIFRALHHHGHDCLATIVSADKAEKISEALPQVRYNPVARTCSWMQLGESKTQGRVVIITAGTSDRPIAEEALETLRWMHCDVELLVDLGVAGPHRLIEQKQKFVDADALVVVAGMEGALPSVVGGHVDCPVIAVPTSVGYGASFNGLAALLGMLNSCAANVTVVNIDSGFKGGYIAGLIARRTKS